MTTRSIVTALVTALLLLPAAPASAQQAKCLAGKTNCMAKKAAGLLKCEALAETPGKPADPNANECVTKARTKFDGGSEPVKGCFEKLEAKDPNDCQSTTTSLTVQGLAENCVAELVAVVAGPASTTSTTIATTSTTLTTTTTTIIFGMGKDLCPRHLRCGSSCCGRRQVCRVDAGGNPTCADSPGCGESGDAICQIPATCILGECLRQCGSTNCRGGVRVPTGPGSFSAVLPFAERCCTTGQGNGLCCDFDTQVCNGAQCRTVICGDDETFVPAIGGCCFNEDVCGSDGNGVGEECCNGTARYFCDPVTVTCKGLAGALCTDGENCFSGSCTSQLCDP